MVVYGGRLSAPCCAGVLELTDQLPLLGVDADHGVAAPSELFAERRDVLKLLVAIPVGSRADLLAIDPERKVHLLEESSHGSAGHLDAELLELLGNLLRCPPDPPEPGHRIATDIVLHDLFDPFDHFGRFFSSGLRPPPSLRTRSISTSRSRSCSLPLATVPTSIPSNLAIFWSPPCPNFRLSRPAYRRLCFSSSRLKNKTIAAFSSSGMARPSAIPKRPGCCSWSFRARIFSLLLAPSREQ